jgi:Rap1a immunity proteins
MACAQSAGEMVSACKQVSVAKTNERVTMLPRDFDSGLCWGAFGALEQFVKTSDEAKRPPQPASGICVPENVARSRLIAAFSDFLKTHPERNQEEFYPVARDALKVAFPCQAGLVRSRRQ